MKKILIVIPTYNSSSIILKSVEEIKKHMPSAKILIVDQHSEDRTNQILENNKTEFSYLHLPLPVSYYEAMSLAMLYANNNNFDIVIEWDDKKRYDVEDLSKFIKIFESGEYDLLLTSRFSINPNANDKLFKYFKFPLRTIFRMITNAKVTDPLLRFRIYGKRAINLFGDNLHVQPSPYGVARLIKTNLKYIELETKLKGKMWKDRYEANKWFWKIIFARKLLTKKEKGQNV